MEIWDLYDEQGNKTGETWERSRAYEIPEGRYHIVCDVLVRHQDGSFLLTLRDSQKEMYPGCWEASAGGSALAGETPEDCARREMLEETGLKAEKLELISVSYRPQSHSVLYAWLSVVNCQKEAVRLQEGETVDYRWMAPDSFLSLISEEPILKIQYPRYKPYLDQLKENCRMEHGKYMKRCYELAIRAGKKGFDTFGAVLVHDGEILEEAENTADWEKGIFGHAEFNVVHKCANRYSDPILKESVLYTSCAPCERCLCAIASLGVENVVFGVSYEEFSKLTPCDAVQVDREGLLQQLGIQMKLTGPVLEDEGMHVFEWWGGEYRPLEELLAEMAEVRAKNNHAVQRAGSAERF